MSLQVGTSNSPTDLAGYFKSKLGKITPSEFDDIQSLWAAIHQVTVATGQTADYAPLLTIDALANQRLVSTIGRNSNPQKILLVGKNQGVNANILSSKNNQVFICSDLPNDFNYCKHLSHCMGRPQAVTQIISSELHSRHIDLVLANNDFLLESEEKRESIFAYLAAGVSPAQSESPKTIIFNLNKHSNFINWENIWITAGRHGFNILFLNSTLAILAQRGQDNYYLQLLKSLTMGELEYEDRVIESDQLIILLELLNEL